MKKLYCLCASLLLFTFIVFAQQRPTTGRASDEARSAIPKRTIVGRVVDETGNAIAFASIKTKDAKNSSGVSADAEGKFILKQTGNEIYVVSAVGFIPKEMSFDSETVTVILVKAPSALQEVIVTSGFGIKKSDRVTPYSAQVLKADNVNMTRQQNLSNALAGKVAGVQSRGQSGAKLNSETFLRVRGGLGLGDRSALYVIDGTIANSFDLNPDDIEDITVLKGANATALFGSLATGGAIVINTKKKVSNKGFGVDVNSGFTVGKVYVLPKYQNLYAGGANSDLTKFVWTANMPQEWKAFDGKYYLDYTDDASWGPRMSGQEHIPWYAYYPGHSRSFKTTSLLPQPDNNRDFWQTEFSSNNNISFGKTSQGFVYRVSYTNQHVTGILPNSKRDRNILYISGSADLNTHFTVASNMNFTATHIEGDFNDGYANNAGANFNQWFHRDLDIKLLKEYKDLRSPYGTLATWNLRYNPPGYNAANPENFYKANYWDNPYVYYANRPRFNDRDNFFGDASVTYKLNNEFRVRGTVRKNQLNILAESISTSLLQNSGLQTGNTAGYATGQYKITRYDYEFIGNMNKKFGDFAVTVNAGGNIQKRENFDVTSNTNGGLNIPDLYSLSNSINPITVGNTRIKEQINSLLSSGEIEYKKIASVSYAIRNDWGSTLSDLKPSLFYPSAGASVILTELVKAPSWLSYGKIFGSWGKKPELLDVYATNFTYGVAQNLWNGNFLSGVPNTYPDPSLTGALITTMEVGADVKFLKNRLGLNFVYYHETANKIPVSIPINGVSGYTATTVNAARIERTGIEVIFNGKPIQNKDIVWDVTSTFAYLIKNPVKQLFGDQTRIAIPLPAAYGSFGSRFAQAFQVLGEDWGQLYGNGLKRNEDGIPLLNPTSGLFVNDATKVWGSIVPKVTGGFLSNLSYKNFNLNFSLDYQVGGKFFSLSEAWGHYSGLFEASAASNDKGFNIRDDIADGGGVHVVGVSSVDGKTPVDMYVDAQTYWHQFYNNSIAEPFVHDLTFVKLREVSLGYNVPVKKMGKAGKYFQGMTFSIIAVNPWLIYSAAKNFDPSEMSTIYGEDGQLPGTRSIGVNVTLKF